jgi:signal transduction histidine kinase
MFELHLLQTGTNPTNLPLPYLGFSLFIILVCTAALLKVLRKWQQGRYPQGFRMVQGLTGLVILRLINFLFTYFSWQTEGIFSRSILVLDQSISVIGVIIILWLWSYPEPSKEVDPGVLGGIGLILILTILEIFFVPSLLDGFFGSILFWQGLSILLIIAGTTSIVLRKPNFWIYGVFMGGILVIGSILVLISSDLEALHLSQLAAYPLLLLFGERFSIAEIFSQETPTRDEIDRRTTSVDITILSKIQKIFDDKDPAGILYNIAQAASYLILADLTLIIDTPDEHGKLRIIAGYDLIREEPLQALTLESKSVPLISSYIEKGKMLHIPASSTSRDLSNLSKVLQLTKPGHLLASPVYIPSATKTIGVVLFSPFSNRPWTKKDQDYLRTLSKLFSAAFSHHLTSQDGESDSVKNTIRDLSNKLTKLTQDKQQLKEDKVVLSKEHQNLLLDHDTLTAKYNQLQVLSNALNQHLVMLVDLEKKGSTEALKKYIKVIDKEVKEIKEADAVAIKEKPLQPVAEHPPQEEEFDSQTPANLVGAVSACLADAESLIKEKKLKTKLDMPDDPPLLKMNHTLFREIFSFLVSNAIEESKSGSEILIRTQIYEEDKNQHFAHINISDKGDGYFPDEIAAVLNDSLSAEQQDKLTQVMTNLYVTKNLVESEGGRMWVESVPGEGTTVSLLLAFI